MFFQIWKTPRAKAIKTFLAKGLPRKSKRKISPQKTICETINRTNSSGNSLSLDFENSSVVLESMSPKSPEENNEDSEKEFTTLNVGFLESEHSETENSCGITIEVTVQ